MQEDLPGLARELRKETCPRRVIDATLRRIAAETPPPSRLRYALPVALASLVVFCALLVVRRPVTGNDRPPQRLAAQQAYAPAGVAREAEGALQLIGTVLVDAGAHSKSVISERAIPPLRNGFETARNKIIHHTEL